MANSFATVRHFWRLVSAISKVLVLIFEILDKATAFIHEHNIAHGDIDFQNMVMDVMVSEPKAPFGAVFAGVRGPERKYAFIDFETATLPAPSDSSSPDAEHCVQRCSPAADFACASKRDVDDLASALEIHLRVSNIAVICHRLQDSVSAVPSVY